MTSLLSSKAREAISALAVFRGSGFGNNPIFNSSVNHRLLMFKPLLGFAMMLPMMAALALVEFRHVSPSALWSKKFTGRLGNFPEV